MFSVDRLLMIGPDTRLFWQSGSDGVLRLPRRSASGHWNHPPYPLRAECGSENVAPTPIAGAGTIYSFFDRPGRNK